jgi:hypothetical protein
MLHRSLLLVALAFFHFTHSALAVIQVRATKAARVKFASPQERYLEALRLKLKTEDARHLTSVSKEDARHDRAQREMKEALSRTQEKLRAVRTAEYERPAASTRQKSYLRGRRQS